MQEIHYTLILMGALVAVASPGPATLAIAATTMNQGRIQGMVLAAGILTAGLFWSFSAAFGLGTLLYANVWLFESIGYCGAAYLLFLAYKSFRSALSRSEPSVAEIPQTSLRIVYLKGLAIHLTNPKPILFFGALYSLGLPSTATAYEIVTLIALLGIQSAAVFFGYALVFSNAKIQSGYFKMKRTFEAVFALFFGIAGIKILLSKLNT